MSYVLGKQYRGSQIWCQAKMQALEERKIIEAAAWDRLHTGESSRSAIYKSAELSRLYTENWICSNVRGKTFLDICCGKAGFTNLAAKSGAAHSIGIDISGASIHVARAAQIPGTQFIEGDCEDTGLPCSSIGAALCTGSIQHLDFERFLTELRRILVPGGKCLVVSALAYNPVLAVYRKLTPQLRTEWSQANLLTLRKLRRAERFLEVRNIRYWHLTSPAAVSFPALLSATNAIDNVLTRVWPIRLLSWMVSFELTKT